MVANLSLKFYLNYFFRLKNSPFIKNMFVVMSGTVVAQAIGFAMSPIISRLFSPSDFGVYGSFNAVFGVIAAGVTLDYSQAIMIPKEKEEAINLLILSCICVASISICFLFVLLFKSNFILNLVKTTYTWIPVLLFISILTIGFNQICQAWCIRVKAFKHTSASQIIRSVAFNGSQVGFGFLKSGGLGLIISSIISDLISSLNLARIVFRELQAGKFKIKWRRLIYIAKEYHDFPLYSASENVINTLSQGLPVLLLAHFYGVSVAGAYTFGLKIIQTPMSFVLRSLRQVLFQKACEVQNNGGSLTPLYLKITLGLFFLALLPSIILFIWAPQIFTWLFGIQWYTAGEFVRSLVLWMTFMFCNLPSVLFARIIRIQRTFFLLEMVLFSSRTIVLIVGGIYMSASYTIMLFSLVGAIMNIIGIIIVGHILKNKDRNKSNNIVY